VSETGPRQRRRGRDVPLKWIKLEQVICRTEAVPDERPLKFRWQGRWVVVERLCGQWLEMQAADTGPAYKVFELECELGRCRLRVRQGGWVWEMQEIGG